MRKLAAIAAVALIACPPAFSAPCKDAKGRFIKCPPAKPTGPCKDARGKFVKCGSPGAKPAK